MDRYDADHVASGAVPHGSVLASLLQAASEELLEASRQNHNDMLEHGAEGSSDSSRSSLVVTASTQDVRTSPARARNGAALPPSDSLDQEEEHVGVQTTEAVGASLRATQAVASTTATVLPIGVGADAHALVGTNSGTNTSTRTSTSTSSTSTSSTNSARAGSGGGAAVVEASLGATFEAPPEPPSLSVGPAVAPGSHARQQTLSSPFPQPPIGGHAHPVGASPPSRASSQVGRGKRERSLLVSTS